MRTNIFTHSDGSVSRSPCTNAARSISDNMQLCASYCHELCPGLVAFTYTPSAWLWCVCECFCHLLQAQFHLQPLSIKANDKQFWDANL